MPVVAGAAPAAPGVPEPLSAPSPAPAAPVIIPAAPELPEIAPPPAPVVDVPPAVPAPGPIAGITPPPLSGPVALPEGPPALVIAYAPSEVAPRDADQRSLSEIAVSLAEEGGRLRIASFAALADSADTLPELDRAQERARRLIADLVARGLPRSRIILAPPAVAPLPELADRVLLYRE